MLQGQQMSVKLTFYCSVKHTEGPLAHHAQMWRAVAVVLSSIN